MVHLGCEGGNYNEEEYAKNTRVWFLIDRINHYNDLARMTKEVRNYSRDSALTWWRMSDDDMAHWQCGEG